MQKWIYIYIILYYICICKYENKYVDINIYIYTCTNDVCIYIYVVNIHIYVLHMWLYYSDWLILYVYVNIHGYVSLKETYIYIYIWVHIRYVSINTPLCSLYIVYIFGINVSRKGKHIMRCLFILSMINMYTTRLAKVSLVEPIHLYCQLLPWKIPVFVCPSHSSRSNTGKW